MPPKLERVPAANTAQYPRRSLAPRTLLGVGAAVVLAACPVPLSGVQALPEPDTGLSADAGDASLPLAGELALPDAGTPPDATMLGGAAPLPDGGE